MFLKPLCKFSCSQSFHFNLNFQKLNSKEFNFLNFKRKIIKQESPAALFKGSVARVCVVAPLFGIAQMFYYLGVAEALMGLKPLGQI